MQTILLTDEHRAWLRQPINATRLCYDLTLAFMRRFNLTPTEAGELFKQWIQEVY